MGKENELRYFDTLTKIANAYMTTEQLKKKAEKEYGVSYHEALEMAYENLQAEAAAAIFAARRPRLDMMKSKSQRKKFFKSLETIPGYICRECWKSVAVASGSKEPMCRCEQPVTVPVNVVVSLPDNWWKK